MGLLRKITVMAFLGAFGAVIGAILGETLFLDNAPRDEPRKICLLFDVSGSMSDTVPSAGRERRVTQLSALKDAACEFVSRQNLEVDPMGLAVFSSDAHVVAGLSGKADRIQRSIRGLVAHGGTNLGRGLDVADRLLADEPGERWILIFSDGKPETSSTGETPERAALNAAARCRANGIQIVAIGTGLADASLLARVTGSASNVIVSDPRALEDAFRRSEEVINRQMLASSATTGSFRRNVGLTGLWAGLIAVGAGLGLVVAQNRNLRRRALGVKEAAIAIAGGVVTGFAAGAAGQTVFYLLAGEPSVVAMGRVVAWTLLGCGIGFGMGFFVPNLPRDRAGAAGGAGGALAAFAFLTLVPIVGDTIGRLLAAIILGVAVGMMMVLVEAACRKAWLIVHWSSRERSRLLLGSTPIVIGSASQSHILVPLLDSDVAVAATITLTADGVVQLEDGHTGATRNLADGEILTFGPVRVEVRASGSGRPALVAEPETPKPVTSSPGKTHKPKAKWYEVSAER